LTQVVGLVGSLLILIAFATAQRNRLSTTSPVYLLANLAGSGILTAVALHGRQWAFVVLELCWALVSGRTLLRVLRDRM
jgi:hypothetical protein